MYDAVNSPEFYNITEGGNVNRMFGEKNGMYGKQHTEEAKRKMRENHYDQSGENNHMHGKHHSKETRRKISERNKGKHNTPNVFLLEKDVLEIVSLRKQGFTQKEIAQKFGVSQSMISNICNGKRYSSITGINCGSRNE